MEAEEECSDNEKTLLVTLSKHPRKNERTEVVFPNYWGERELHRQDMVSDILHCLAAFQEVKSD